MKLVVVGSGVMLSGLALLLAQVAGFLEPAFAPALGAYGAAFGGLISALVGIIGRYR